jgi:hypothetical protein
VSSVARMSWGHSVFDGAGDGVLLVGLNEDVETEVGHGLRPFPPVKPSPFAPVIVAEDGGFAFLELRDDSVQRGAVRDSRPDGLA